MQTTVIKHIVEQHAEEAAFLWHQREAATRAPNYSLDDLIKLDNRVEAHLDGLRIAGEYGWQVCEQALAAEEAGEVFAAAFLAFESGNGEKIDKVVSAGSGSAELFEGLVSALCWQNETDLKALLSSLLTANSPIYQRLAIIASALQRIDPGQGLTRAVNSEDLYLKARALRAVGDLKRRDLLPVLRENFNSDDLVCRFSAVRSALLLGDHSAIGQAQQLATNQSVFVEETLNILLRVMKSPDSQIWLRELALKYAQDSGFTRYIIIGAGIIGDPVYIPMLLQQMDTPENARVAGEALALITGVDLALQDLEGDMPDDFEAGPTENPEDENVTMDPDEDLPWPEPALIKSWWAANEQNYQAGTRYLAGKTPDVNHCRDIMLNGVQTHRAAAAMELALGQQDLVLFDTTAPGFRQKAMMV